MPHSCPPSATLLGSLGALWLLAGGCAPDALPDGSALAREAVLGEAGYVEGQYEARIASMLDGTSRITHHLRVGDQVLELLVDDPALERPEYDSFVRAPGAMAPDGRWQADDLVVISPPPQPLVDPDFRDPRRIGTVLVFWEGEGALPNGEADNRMYNAPDSTNIYYGEISYGIETLAGKVFGPYEIENPGGCYEDLVATRADAAMIERGHDPTQFRQMMYYFPGGQGCGWAGLASIGSPTNPARNSWYHGSFGCTTRNQELGHNYGMGHSHAYSCPPTPEGLDHNFYEDCEHIEYGHPYDPMGNGCGHMNVVQKTYMGWLEGCNVVSTTSSGTFNLMPIELPCDGTQALSFPAYDGRHYYIEYRNGSGEFAVGNGVLVNVAGKIGGFGPTGYVLDEIGELGNGYLHEGESFTDPGNGNTITVVEEHDSHVVIELTMGEGATGHAPTCRDGRAPVMEDGAVGSLACASEPYPGDDAPPEIVLTYPVDGQNFAVGSDFSITGEAQDDRGVIEVALYLAKAPDELDGNAAPYDVKTEPPWAWDAVNIEAGTYTFAMVARDARNLTASQIVTIEVGDPAPPVADSGTDATGDPMADDGDSTSTGGDGGLTETDGGCNCRAGGGWGGAAYGLLLLPLGWLRRRRWP